MASKPWHEGNSGEFAQIRAQLEREFPYLQVIARDGQTVLTGDLPLMLDGRVIDQFEIDVIVPPGGTRSEIPIVREIGRRIPHHSDRHVEQATGNACLFVRDEYWFKHPNGLDLLEFLRGPVTSYFVAQHSYEQGNGWPFGQRAHGADGIIEFYTPILGVSSRATVERYLKVLAAKKVRAHWECPCGSGQPISVCHGSLIQGLRTRIRRSAASYSLTILQGQTASLCIRRYS